MAEDAMAARRSDMEESECPGQVDKIVEGNIGAMPGLDSLQQPFRLHGGARKSAWSRHTLSHYDLPASG
jgi:hypothetical protein